MKSTYQIKSEEYETDKIKVLGKTSETKMTFKQR